MAAGTDSNTDAQFESIDWERMEDSAPLAGRRTVAFLVSVGLLAGLFCYDWFIAASNQPTLGTQGGLNWDVTRLDWLFVLSLLALLFYVVVPLASNREQTKRYWRRLRTNKVAVVSVLYLVGFIVVGTVGPILLGRPDANILAKYQPPLLFTVEGSAALNCLGEVTQSATSSLCHGTLQYPLGTTIAGAGMLTVVVVGMRISLQVALITSMIIVPIATTVGTVAGYAGGLTDEILMRYVDVQQAVPAFLVYLILIFVLGRSLFLIVLVFGLLSWGGVARLVRSETIQRREEGYIMAARNAGVGRAQILRRHLLPNVSSTVITATTHLIPLLILAEAALAFLELGVIALPSWGQTIALSYQGDYFLQAWWVWLLPLLFLTATVTSLSVLGDALRDALDPRGEP
jgi:peptide/nickel transport system permease protein